MMLVVSAVHFFEGKSYKDDFTYRLYINSYKNDFISNLMSHVKERMKGDLLY